ncbi:MAG: SRPBCC family protein [Dehalococcoidia bacterium]
MRYEHSLEINAAPDKVWTINLDIERWPELAATMTRVERVDDGPFRLGSQAKVTQPGLGTRVWTVERFEPGKSFAWSTRLGTVRLTGTHLVEPTPAGSRCTLGIELRGFGGGLIGRMNRKRMEESIRLENEGFKRAAEAGQGVRLAAVG